MIVIMQFLNLAVKIQCFRVIARHSASIFAIVKRFDHKAGESNTGLKNQYRLITLINFLYRCLRWIHKCKVEGGPQSFNVKDN